MSSAGPRPFTKLLVANRGEIARRIFSTASSMGISTVAVFSDPDAGSPHVRDADESVRLPGASPAETYLAVDAVVDAAVRTGADALHPGYGFLSENVLLARACAAAGIVFVGPGVDAVETMGSKLAAKELVAGAGVPTLDSVDLTGLDPEDVAARAKEIGFPVLLKASAGGGGRGMRVVEDPLGMADAVESAAREAQSAFGDGTVFMEKYLRSPRHVEIQVFGDTHGNVVHLFERECSIQRRHQKIIEESPSPALTPELRAAMGAAAVRCAESVRYVGAGTVEFLLDGEGNFWFLEMNTRLQVEHPVTEAVTGLDLVRLQILIAMGQPLPPEALSATMSGHAIEARLYAEDPTRAWLPSTGQLRTFELGPPSGFAFADGVRCDAGVEAGSLVSPHYDPMLAKVIARASTRDEAATLLARALTRARLHGVATNRDLLVSILGHCEFRDGTTDTGFLERHDPAVLGATRCSEETEMLHAVAAVLAGQALRRARARTFTGAPSGWRNNPSRHQSVRCTSSIGTIEIRYLHGRDGFAGTAQRVPADGEPPPPLEFGPGSPFFFLSVGEDRVEMDVGGVRVAATVVLDGAVAYVDSTLGFSVLTEEARFPDATQRSEPGSLLSPMPGTVVRVDVCEGDVVDAGATLVVIEAMKMEHSVSAPFRGSVARLHAAPGDQVDASAVLAVLEEIEE